MRCKCRLFTRMKIDKTHLRFKTSQRTSAQEKMPLFSVCLWSSENNGSSAEKDEERAGDRRDVFCRNEPVQSPGNEDAEEGSNAEGSEAAEENGEEALIFYGQEQGRDLGLVAHLGDGDEAEGGDEARAGRGLDLPGLSRSPLAQKHVQPEENEHPGGYTGDEVRREKFSQPFSDDGGAAGQERERQHRSGEHRPAAVPEGQGKDHELRLVTQLGSEDEAEGNEEDGYE